MAGVLLWVLPALQAESFVRGKVVMEDGSIPEKTVEILRTCGAHDIHEASTDHKGEFIIHDALLDAVRAGTIASEIGSASCILRASLPGYDSTQIDLSRRTVAFDPMLPPLVLTPRGANRGTGIAEDVAAPRAVQKPWNQAMKAAHASNWQEAERALRVVVEGAPRFAQGWSTLGMICQNQQEVNEARDAYRHAVEIDPKSATTLVLLMRLDVVARDWEAASKSSDALIKVDVNARYPEAYLDKAIALYHLHDMAGAETSVAEAIRLDKKKQLARTEYVWGLILEAKHDYSAAAEHMRKYLELEPKASDAAVVRQRLESLGKDESADVGKALDAVDMKLPAATEGWVPGGMKALGAAAHLKEATTFQRFFADYCAALVRHASGADDEARGYVASIQAYLESAAELLREGERKGDAIEITLSMAGDAERRQTERILTLLGWRLVQSEGATRVELGDRPADGLRQEIPAVFGIDEISMQEALEAGRSFRFAIPMENARLIGGDAWMGLIAGQAVPPGGIAEAFARDLRLAKVYVGLSTMGADTAAAVVSGVGLRALVLRHADLLARYADAFAVSQGWVALPGGMESEAVWAKLAGASPRDPPAFFRALLEKDRGRLVEFYFAVSRGSAAQQRFFTKTQSRAERFYHWHTEAEMSRGGSRLTESWQTAFFRKVPLDSAGNVRFPGGRRVWGTSNGPDEDVLLSMSLLEPFPRVAQIEDLRKAPLDESSVSLLVRRYAEWRPLFPYFERMPGLAAPDFQALASFTDAVEKLPQPRRTLVLGAWHSLVELMVLGAQSGSLAGLDGARIFRHACDSLKDGDLSTQAVQILREMVGDETNIDDAVRRRLLRLQDGRRVAYDQMIELQKAPSVAAAIRSHEDKETVAALGGLVYAAWLDPRGLLVAEDPLLLRKHRYIDPNPRSTLNLPFENTVLNLSSKAPGTYISGGFANFEQVATGLAHGRMPGELRLDGTSADAPLPDPVGGPSLDARPSIPGEVFRADARLVEVYATVTDSHGKYVDNLTGPQFTILEGGKSQPVAAFEARTSDLSCALVLDTTGSMQSALPALKSAALKLIGELRPNDSVAVYTFSERVSLVQEFTTDKNAAKRAVLRAHAAGATALYDTLVQVNRDLTGRSGKKVIVVFTDGADNASALMDETAIRSAKRAGVPVYTVAQGEALESPESLKHLADVSKSTGGLSFSIRFPTQIRRVFESIAEDLAHGYLIAFRPSTTEDREYRQIEVVVRGAKNYKVRAREGYYPQ